MVTENQSQRYALAMAERAKEKADSDWQLVVDKLNQKIADLKNEEYERRNKMNEAVVKMHDKTKMDCRTRQQVQEETINSICELQDAIDALFSWRIAQDDSEIILSNNTIQLVIKHINQLKGEAK